MTMRRRSRAGRVVGDRHGNPDMMPWRSTPRFHPAHRGITRQARTPRPKPPLTDAHKLVLAALTDEPTRPRDLRVATGLSSSSLHAALYALSARELATRTGRGGWVRAAPPNNPTGDNA